MEIGDGSTMKNSIVLILADIVRVMKSCSQNGRR